MNPFRFSEPLPPRELIDRDEEAKLLLDAAVEGNNCRLIAPRRYGKTSLLKKHVDHASRRGYMAVYVDFFGVLTLADVAIRIERAYALQLQGRLATWFEGVRQRLRPSLRIGFPDPVPTTFEFSLDPQSEQPLIDRLALPVRLFEKTGVRSTIVFDEFQDVLAARDRADAIIRSEIQHHGDAASYVFAGSQMGMMRRLFADKRRAMYGQAMPIELEPLDPEDVARYLDRRFRESGKQLGDALGPLLEAAQGHPQRTMLLAHLLWNHTRSRGKAGVDQWEAAYEQAQVWVQDEMRAIWTGLPTGQRRILAAVAANTSGLYAGKRPGGSRGGAVKTATQALADLGEIARDPSTRTRWRVVDPLLATWITSTRHSP